MHHLRATLCVGAVLVAAFAFAPALSSQVEFGPERALSASSWNQLAADFDGDGLVDLATGSSALVPAVWLRNTYDETAFTTRTRLTPFEQIEPNLDAFHAAADLDADGDPDVLLSRRVGEPYLAWLEQGVPRSTIVDLGGALAGTAGAPELAASGSMLAPRGAARSEPSL